MRPLPRLHAVTDARTLARSDLARLAGRMAAVAGAGLALHARDRALAARPLLARATLLAEVATAAEAALFVNARVDVAAAAGAAGVQLGRDDLTPAEARRVLGPAWRGWIGRSVHSVAEARAAAAAGADFLLLGNVYPSASHPGRPGLGAAIVAEAAAGGCPVVAIGGVTPANAAELRAAGAWGVAAITALWEAPDPAAAALDLLAPWLDAA